MSLKKKCLIMAMLLTVVIVTVFFIVSVTNKSRFPHHPIEVTEKASNILQAIEHQESEISMDTVSIATKGIDKEYHFLFFSDSHALSVTPETESKQITDYFSPREAGFVSSSGVKSADMLKKWVEVANNSEIDGVLLGGDIIDAPTDNNLSILQTSLNELKAPYLYVLGNHDWTYTWAYCNDTARNEYLPKFKSFFKDGNSDFQVLEFEDLAIVGLDNSADQFTQAAADAFSNYVKNLNKPIILIMHVPIHGSNIQTTCEAVWGRDISLGESGIIPNQASQQIINLIEDQNSPVIGVLSGHIHMNAQDELNSKGTLETTADAAYKGRGILLTIKPE